MENVEDFMKELAIYNADGCDCQDKSKSRCQHNLSQETIGRIQQMLEEHDLQKDLHVVLKKVNGYVEYVQIVQGELGKRVKTFRDMLSEDDENLLESVKDDVKFCEATMKKFPAIISDLKLQNAKLTKICDKLGEPWKTMALTFDVRGTEISAVLENFSDFLKEISQIPENGICCNGKKLKDGINGCKKIRSESSDLNSHKPCVNRGISRKDDSQKLCVGNSSCRAVSGKGLTAVHNETEVGSSETRQCTNITSDDQKSKDMNASQFNILSRHAIPHCVICNVSFGKRKNFKRHMVSVHNYKL